MINVVFLKLIGRWSKLSEQDKQREMEDGWIVVWVATLVVVFLVLFSLGLILFA